MKDNKTNIEPVSPWSAYWKECEELTKKAENLVRERIKGTRKGFPREYNCLHSFRVRDIVSACHHRDDPDYDLFIAALLHDIVEDGGVSLEELKKLGFTDRTIQLVKLCTHSFDIKDHTERWIMMVARLIEAKDNDAWRIKLADLTDNLNWSKGLSPENRRFMVEVKAGLIYRLANVPYSAHYKLEEAMDRQKKELAKQWRYVVTRWVESYDYDGLTEDFALLGSFDDRGEAMVCAATETEAYIRNKLDVNIDWHPIVRDDESRTPYSNPNKLNKVIFSKTAYRRDKTGYNSEYVFIDVIEVPYNTVIDERLFDTQRCGGEVFRFFDESHKEPKNKDMLFNLKRGRKQPTQCHLWQKDELVHSDLDNAFDVVHTFSDGSHFGRELVKCKQCQQLYLKEFYEQIDWIDGEDPQYLTYIPVENMKEAELINQVGLWEFQTFAPCIKRDWPKGKPRKIYWIGRINTEEA